ncbi:helix-turn-helix domain-containing protein [Photobacterium damselae]|uniref:helix-turn-helix domain-containing protein n=1 Tax=Photobacterium damselae TaxID=38293 RepID=UPI001EFCF072|nr:helix-turn-helix domain-containing protein [Photobacterium damselae]MCG9778704.1 helix-turn-helix domain-containing protein [Photobacterium damselae]
MSTNQGKIPPFDYSGGRNFTDRLLNVTGVSNLVELSDLINVPRTTISTWHRRDMTAYEIVVRICLATGASLRYVALGEGEPFDLTTKIESTSIALKKEILQDGNLTPSNTIKFDEALLNSYNLTKENIRLIEYDFELMLVDMNKNNPTSGRYLIDIDSSISINHLQKLPGKRLAVSFGDSAIEISETDISVLGRVVMTVNKE